MPTVLDVSGMSCDGCEEIVTTALEEVSGVEAVEVDHETGTAEVVGDPESAALEAAVDYAGYSATVQPAEADS